jgi:phage gp36-like protein
MAYADQASVILAAGGMERALDLADWNKDKRLDENVIAAAIAAADGMIDSYLVLRHQVPLALPSDLVKSLSAAAAVYWIRDSRNMVTESDVKAYEQREALLIAMRDGKLSPHAPNVNAPANHQSAFVEFDSPVSRKKSRGMW